MFGTFNQRYGALKLGLVWDFPLCTYEPFSIFFDLSIIFVPSTSIIRLSDGPDVKFSTSEDADVYADTEIWTSADADI